MANVSSAVRHAGNIFCLLVLLGVYGHRYQEKGRVSIFKRRCRVIADVLVVTLSTPDRVPSKGRRPADGNGSTHTVLLWRHGGTITGEIGSAILADHIRHFEGWASHRNVSSGNASRGLGVACRACGVTWR
jgi:hypothetical protein